MSHNPIVTEDYSCLASNLRVYAFRPGHHTHERARNVIEPEKKEKNRENKKGVSSTSVATAPPNHRLRRELTQRHLEKAIPAMHNRRPRFILNFAPGLYHLTMPLPRTRSNPQRVMCHSRLPPWPRPRIPSVHLRLRHPLHPPEDPPNAQRRRREAQETTHDGGRDDFDSGVVGGFQIF